MNEMERAKGRTGWLDIRIEIFVSLISCTFRIMLFYVHMHMLCAQRYAVQCLQYSSTQTTEIASTGDFYL